VYVLPLFLYMLLIFALSSIPHYPEILPWVFNLDKFIHIVGVVRVPIVSGFLRRRVGWIRTVEDMMEGGRQW